MRVGAPLNVSIGNRSSRIKFSNESIREQYIVSRPHFLPSMITPSISNTTLIESIYTDCVIPRFILNGSFARIIAMPLTPPVAKPLGALKKYIPVASISMPRLIKRKCFSEIPLLFFTVFASVFCRSRTIIVIANKKSIENR